MSDLPDDLELLFHRVEALEKRVHALEHPGEEMAQAAEASPAREAVVQSSAIERASGVFPVLGQSMLGIAGAYVLRALVELSSLPKLAIAVVAIAYAVAWLMWAVKAAGRARFAGAVYAGTSALILGPMLWELALRFKILSPPVIAGVLGGIVVLATVLAWKRELEPVFWVAHFAAALTALALSIATHAMTPFIATLLLSVLICEYAAAQDRCHTLRPLVTAMADAAIWLQLFMYSGPASARSDYPEVGVATLLTPACVLFLINGTHIAIRTVWLQKKISLFETIQVMIAFLLAVSGLLFFLPTEGKALVGAVCLLFAAAAYSAVILRFQYAEEKRNFRVFAAWSAALLLAGALWSLPTAWAAACLAVAALLAVTAGVWLQYVTLDLHSVAYLLVAASIAGLPGYVADALMGTQPASPSWSILVVAASAALCYAVARERVGEAWPQQVLHFVPALLASGAVAALLVQGLLRLLAVFLVPGLFHLAFIRTLSVCSLALALAFGGRVLRRLEMTRIAYAAVAFMAAKLIFEDLREGRMDFIAVSFFLFAVTLIAVPRLSRTERKT